LIHCEKIQRRCFAVTVVLYLPSGDAFENLCIIIGQFALVIVVVNGLDDKGWSQLHMLTKDKTHVLILDSDGNVGIAAALNMGAQAAREKNFAWMATFDQDTLIETNFVMQMLQNWSSLPNVDQVGLITPVHVTRHKQGHVGYCPILADHGTWAEVGSVITSGNIISLDAWVAVGGFCEDLFIDFVDYEYCFRLLRMKYRIVQLRNVLLQHEIGEQKYIPFCGIYIPLDSHGPLRYYYIFRNFLRILPDNLWLDPYFFFRSAIAIFLKGGLLLVFDCQRRVYAHNMARGVIDAFRKRGGKF